jgi:uncharacterized SAM-binding protein YcdF (DUF218 family)
MIKPFVNTQTILLTLIAVNLLLFFVIRTYKKYFLGQTMVFLLAILTFLVFHIFIFPRTMKPIEEERERETKEVGIENAKSVWYNNETENTLYSFNRPVFEIITFQTILTFIFSLGGLFLTAEKKLFKRLSFAFGVMTAIVLFVFFMASIIPTNGIVG